MTIIEIRMLRKKTWRGLWVISTLLITVILNNVSCSSSSDSGGKMSMSFKASRINSSTVAQGVRTLDRVAGRLRFPKNPHSVLRQIGGQSAATQLESLSYFLKSALLCKNATVNGSGSSCSGGEFSIINNESSGVSYDTFFSAEAEADTTHFVNVLDKTEIQKLAGEISYSDEQVGTYDSAMVYWFRPFKAKTSITLNDGTVLYTKRASSYITGTKPGDVTIQSSVSNITSSPAEEGVFFLPNGGTYFMLPKKFEITSDDVKNQTSYKIVMAFDPDGIIKGSASSCTTSDDWRDGMCDPTLNYKIKAPFLSIAPVIARESETIMRETYILRTTVGFSSWYDIRLSLYYVKEDTDKAIRAVTATPLYTSATEEGIEDFPNIVSTETNTDGTTNFLTSGGTKQLKSFKRLTELDSWSTVATDQMVCTGTTECNEALVTREYAYTLISIGEVDAALTAKYASPSPSPSPSP